MRLLYRLRFHSAQGAVPFTQEYPTLEEGEEEEDDDDDEEDELIEREAVRGRGRGWAGLGLGFGSEGGGSRVIWTSLKDRLGT